MYRLLFLIKLVTGTGGSHRPRGQGHPHSNPPPSSPCIMCMTTILTKTRCKRQDRSVHFAKERRCWAGMMRCCDPICPHSSVLSHASAAQGPKRLISRRIYRSCRQTAGHLGNVGLIARVDGTQRRAEKPPLLSNGMWPTHMGGGMKSC